MRKKGIKTFEITLNVMWSTTYVYACKQWQRERNATFIVKYEKSMKRPNEPYKKKKHIKHWNQSSKRRII